MSFDIVDIAVIVIGAIIGLIASSIWKLRVEPSGRKNYKRHGSFLLMSGS